MISALYRSSFLGHAVNVTKIDVTYYYSLSDQ